ncbi:hypothetical protein OHA25_44725 [Nonomuraea sp. NBC_00507]|uniref:hypothetical protein n=1 Tax=Nonomuraea sp. NBC_00507 TaxID=2976002 RepID=UPI002E171E22
MAISSGGRGQPRWSQSLIQEHSAEACARWLLTVAGAIAAALPSFAATPWLPDDRARRRVRGR